MTHTKRHTKTPLRTEPLHMAYTWSDGGGSDNKVNDLIATVAMDCAGTGQPDFIAVGYDMLQRTTQVA
jgi:hypothetical protein